MKRADHKAKRMEIWDTKKCICRVLFLSDSLSSGWSDSVDFVKFPMLKFSKGFSHSFHSVSTKLSISMLVMGKYSLFLSNIKKLWHFEIFVNTEAYGAGNSNSSYSFHLISPKLYDIGHHGGIQAVTFLSIRPSFKNFI